MGLFDTVTGRCPHCQAEVGLQSKAGECMLEVYTMNDVPVGIAVDLLQNYLPFNTHCPSCNGKFLFETETPIQQTVKCLLVKVESKG